MHHTRRAKTKDRRSRRFRRRSFETSPKPPAHYESLLCYMRLPPDLIESLWFQHRTAGEFFDAFRGVPAEEREASIRLADAGLPPATSVEALSVIFGLNPGIIQTISLHQERYYRTFDIKNGKKTRTIQSPKVVLKLIQKWAGFHLSRIEFQDHLYGFVPGRSHIDAAIRHIGADWSYSVDIKDFFNSTPDTAVYDAFQRLGYSPSASALLRNLCTLRGYLPQGSPASPAISNICFSDTDTKLQQLAEVMGAALTRYADDIVFSGRGDFPKDLPQSLDDILGDTPWILNKEKVSHQPLKGRIKIHGLLVKNNSISLTKGYRNKIRAFRHLWQSGLIRDEDRDRIKGHLSYARSVETRPECKSHFSWEDFELHTFPQSQVSSEPKNLALPARLKRPTLLQSLIGLLKRD